MPRKDKDKDDDIRLAALILIVGAMFAWAMWVLFSVQISSAVRWLRVGEMYLISLWTDSFDQLREEFIALRPEFVTPRYIAFTTREVMNEIKIPASVIIGGLMVWNVLKQPGGKLQRKLGMEGLIKDLSSVFPVTSPIIKFNPLKNNSRMPGRPVPSKLPPMAEALSPEEWVAYHGIPVHQGQMDTHYVRQAFAKQLKGRWNGIHEQPPHIQALFAVFALKNAKKRDESDKLLGDIAQCWSLKKGLDLPYATRRQIKKIIKNPNLGGAMAKVAANHGFVTTAMMKCLQNARQQGGVLAPATFVWLRAEDRSIWYPLNNLGRRSYHTEAAGAMAHFRAEKMAARPIPTPKVKAAVESLQTHLNTTAVPIPERDYSGEGKASGARAPKTA